MKALILVMLSLLAPEFAHACIGGQYSFNLPDGTECSLRADAVMCGGRKIMPALYFKDILNEPRFDEKRDAQWGNVTVLTNADHAPASNAVGLKLLLDVSANGHDDYVIYRVYEIYINNVRKVIRLDSNRVPGGGMTRGAGPADSSGTVYGVRYDEKRGC